MFPSPGIARAPRVQFAAPRREKENECRHEIHLSFVHGLSAVGVGANRSTRGRVRSTKSKIQNHQSKIKKTPP